MSSDSTTKIFPTFNSLEEAVLNYTWAGGDSATAFSLIRAFDLYTVGQHGSYISITVPSGSKWIASMDDSDTLNRELVSDHVHKAFKDTEHRLSHLIKEVKVCGALPSHAVTKLLEGNTHLLCAHIFSQDGTTTMKMLPHPIDDLKDTGTTLQDMLLTEALIRPILTANVLARWSRVKPCKHCRRMYFYKLDKSEYCSKLCRDAARRQRSKYE